MTDTTLPPLSAQDETILRGDKARITADFSSTVITTETIHPDLGQEVPVSEIERELQLLWAADGAGTRASLMNFAIYSEASASLEPNSRLLATITQEHACRAIVINNVQSCPLDEQPVRAWITAHCQLRGGKKSVCSEQISFLLQCNGNRHVRNIVFAHLDSDLPLVFWWQGELNDNFEDRLYSVIDRLIIDSADWTDPMAGFARLKEAHLDESSRFSVNDLAWSRTHKMRRALSDCFDDRAALSELPSLEEISLVHGPKGQVPALMLAAWIARQAGLKPDGKMRFRNAEGRVVPLSFRSDATSSTVGLLSLRTARGLFSFERKVGFPFIQTRIRIGDNEVRNLTPTTRDRRSAHVCAQLEQAGSNHLYFPMIALLGEMLGDGA